MGRVWLDYSWHKRQWEPAPTRAAGPSLADAVLFERLGSIYHALAQLDRLR